MTEKILGLLELENTVTLPGFLAGPGTFPFRVKRMTVPGATAKSVTEGDRSLKDAYVRCARELESEGVAAITANCGFTSLFQADVSAAVSVPVALSSLMLVPHVARMLAPGQKIGILTYDSVKLTEDHFAAAGWSSKQIRVSVRGIEGSQTWEELLKPDPAPPTPVVIDDVMTATRALLKSEPDIAALVLECSAFPVTAETVRRETRLPAADYVTLAKMLFEMSSPRNNQARVS